MKQIGIAVGMLVLAVVAFYWSSRGNNLKLQVEPVSETNKILYFEIDSETKVGEEVEMKLKIKTEKRKIANFATNFSYDPTMMEILSGQINTTNFDSASATNIDKEMGTVELFGDNGDRSKLEEGEDLVLATFVVKGSKKGNSMLYMSKRPEIYIWDGSDELRDDSYEMPNFKVNFL
jgi:hypothetical protein